MTGSVKGLGKVSQSEPVESVARCSDWQTGEGRDWFRLSGMSVVAGTVTACNFVVVAVSVSDGIVVGIVVVPWPVVVPRYLPEEIAEFQARILFNRIEIRHLESIGQKKPERTNALCSAAARIS